MPTKNPERHEKAPQTPHLSSQEIFALRDSILQTTASLPYPEQIAVLREIMAHSMDDMRSMMLQLYGHDHTGLKQAFSAVCYIHGGSVDVKRHPTLTTKYSSLIQKRELNQAKRIDFSRPIREVNTPPQIRAQIRQYYGEVLRRKTISLDSDSPIILDPKAYRSEQVLARLLQSERSPDALEHAFSTRDALALAGQGRYYLGDILRFGKKDLDEAITALEDSPKTQWEKVDTLDLNQFDFVYKISEGLVVVEKEHLQNVLDLTNKKTLFQKRPSRAILDFCEGFARVTRADSKDNFIDRNGRLLSRIRFDDAEDFSDWFARVYHDHTNQANFIDTTGKLVSKERYSGAQDFSEGFAVVQTKDGLHNYIDTAWHLLDENGFVEAEPFSWGLAKVRHGSYESYLAQITKDWDFNKRKGDQYTTPKIEYEIHKGRQYIDTTGTVPQKAHNLLFYKEVRSFSEGLAPVNIKEITLRFSLDYWNFTDTEGKILSKERFDAVWSFSDGIARVKKQWSAEYNLIDKTGKILLKDWFYGDDAKTLTDWFTMFLNWGRWLIDKAGEKIRHPFMEDISIYKGKIYGKGRLTIEIYEQKPSPTIQKIIKTLQDPTARDPELIKDYLIQSSPNARYRSQLLTQDSKIPSHRVPPLNRATKDAIAQHPEDFLETFVAAQPSSYLSDQMNTLLSPPVPSHPQRQTYGQADSFLDRRDSTGFRGGRPAEGHEGPSLQIAFDKEISPFVTTEAWTITDSGTRQSVDFSYRSLMVWGEANHCHITLDLLKAGPIILPYQLNNFWIEWLTVNGKVTPVTTHANGSKSLDLPRGHHEIDLTLRTSTITPPLPDVSESTYQKTRKDRTDKNGPDLLEDTFGKLPFEVEMFLSDSKNLSVTDKIMACEEFVHEHLRYDADNANADDKAGKPLAQQMAMCSQQRDLLRGQQSDLRDRLEGKLWVGVCEDAANILLILLRRSGIISGKLSGFAQDKSGGRVGHGRNFVILPGRVEGSYESYEVDGTPSSAPYDLPSTQNTKDQFASLQAQLQAAKAAGQDTGPSPLDITGTDTISDAEKSQKHQKHLDELRTNLSQLLATYAKRDLTQDNSLLEAGILQKIRKLPPAEQSERMRQMI